VAFSLLFLPAAAGQGTTPRKAGRPKVKKEEKLYVEDALTPDLPKYKNRPTSYYKAYKYPMKAGVTYTIDMIRREPGGLRDPYLYLEDPSGALVAQDDDSGGALNARMVYRAPRTGTYLIIAASFVGADAGNYVVSARPGGTVGIGGMGGMAPLEQQFGDVIISAEPQPSNFMGGGGTNEYSHGYVEYRFRVENESETDSHRVTVALPQFRAYMNGPYLNGLSRTVEVGPNATATVSLLQPDLAIPFGGSIEVTVDGQKRRASFNMGIAQNRGHRYTGQYGGSGTLIQQILCGENLAIPLSQQVYISAVDRPGGAPRMGMGGFMMRSGMYFDKRDGKNKPYTYSGVHRFLQAPATAAWSTSWLAYSSYDGVALYAAQLEEAPAAVREALWRYVECGGCLVLLGDLPQEQLKLPESWRQSRTEEAGVAPPPVSAATAVGLVGSPLGEGPLLAASAQAAGKAGIVCYYPGLGECLLMPNLPPEQWTPQQWRRLTDAWEHSAQPWQRVRTVMQANDDFPVVEHLGIPVRGLFLLMFVFAVAIGPVNLYVLSRKKRRIWMLWTVPAISLVTCLAVLGYMLVSEGWHGHSRTEGLTILDEGTRRASTVGWAGFYTPVAPSDGLHFSQDTELTPQLAFEPMRPYRPAAPRSLDWTDDQHLTSGWVTARVPAYFSVRKSEGRRRERLALHRGPGGTLSVVNLLGADVGTLWLADRDGKIYTASGVDAGAKATLTAAGKTANGEPGILRELYGQDWLQHYKKLTERPEEYLRPGSYIATLGATPFLDEGLPSARPHHSRSVVYGIMKEGADES
jgi:hypothetical protein